MNWYTADTHFNSYNALVKSKRPFADVGEMNRILIRNINERVNKDDVLYIAGDACSGMHYSIPELKSIQCHKVLVIGNHDEMSLQYGSFCRCFEDIADSMVVNDGKYKIFLSHYPHADWKGARRGVLHFYGHEHEKDCGPYVMMKCIKNAYNVGVDHNNYCPVTVKDMLKKVPDVPECIQDYVKTHVYIKDWVNM